MTTYDDTIEALESGVTPYFQNDSKTKKQIEWGALAKDLARCRKHKDMLTALKPEHAFEYAEMLAQSEREIAAKAQKL